MRPIVIYADEGKEVKMSKERFEELLRQAYDQGFDDGRSFIPAAEPLKPWTQPYITYREPYTMCKGESITTTNNPTCVTLKTDNLSNEQLDAIKREFEK